MSKRIFCLSLIFVYSISASVEIFAQEKLIVGTKVAEPFVIKNTDGDFSGISIDLWKEISAELNLEYELVEFDLEGLTNGLTNKTIDLAVSALTISAEREENFDFSHPFHTTGLAIAVTPQNKKDLTAVISSFLSWKFLRIVLGLFVLLFVIGTAVWFFERKQNKEQFGGSTVEGIGSGIWWSAVTMTTVGYGDKAPQTFGGRLLALFWMFATLIIISSLTAAITSVVTVSQLEQKINSLDDLYNARVATVAGTNSAEVLSQLNIEFEKTETVEEALMLLKKNKVEAVVYDAPILQYLIKIKFKNYIQLLPTTFGRQDYGFGMPEGSLLREDINRLILKKTQSPEWEKKLDKYLK